MINSLKDAIIQFQNAFKGSTVVNYVRQPNGGAIAAILSYNGQYYYLHFIREWFHAFGRVLQIPDLRTGGVDNCEGLTIPMDELQQARERNAILMFALPDRVFVVTASKATKYVNTHNTIYENPKNPTIEVGIPVSELTEYKEPTTNLDDWR